MFLIQRIVSLAALSTNYLQVLAYEDSRPGTVFISNLENIPVHRNIGIEGEAVVVDQGFTSFYYGIDHTLKVTGFPKFLAFSDSGLLVVDDIPHDGFFLIKEPGLRFTKTLSYRGVRNFTLCQDSSVRFNASCTGARSIFITYEDILFPYKKAKFGF